MKKQAYLQKLLVKEAGISFGAAGLALGFMLFVSSMEQGAIRSVSQAKTQLNSTNSQLETLRNQIDKSGTAEKRYYEIRSSRDQEDYAQDTDMVRDRLRGLTDKYRLSQDLSLTLSVEKSPNIASLKALNYDVATREGMTLTFSAMSDIHAFSFLDEFQRKMPGVIRLTKFNIKRTGDLTVGTLSQMTSGTAPKLVDVEMEFLWGTLNPKAEKERR